MFSILATDTAAAGAAGWGSLILWMVVLFGFMYFFMIRPQQKEIHKSDQNHNPEYHSGHTTDLCAC